MATVNQFKISLLDLSLFLHQSILPLFQIAPSKRKLRLNSTAQSFSLITQTQTFHRNQSHVRLFKKEKEKKLPT